MHRAIIHLDMDAFYAAIEQLDSPHLRGKPLIIGWDSARGVVATASYEARPYGVHSAMPMAQARKLCPQAIIVPPRRERYLEVSRHVFRILRSFTPLVEPLSLDEAFLDVTNSHELFGSAREIAQKIRSKIHQETRLTGSAGIGPSKFIAKIASDMRKPDGLFEVQAHDILDFLHPLPVTKIWGVGKVTAKSLQDLGITTIGDLSRFPRQTLVSRFGTHGQRLFELAHGIDDRPVNPQRAVKSIGEEETFAEDLSDNDKIQAVLLQQAQDVARRLRKRALAAKTITVKIKLAERLGGGKFRLYTRSHSLPAATNDASEIYRAAALLFQSVPRKTRAVRLAGIYTSNMESEQAVSQLDLFTSPSQTNDKRQRLGKALDRLSQKYGDGVVHYGSVAKSHSAKSEDPAALRKDELG